MTVRVKNILWGAWSFLLLSTPQVVGAQWFPGNTNTPGRFSDPFIGPLGYGSYSGGTPQNFTDFIYLIVYFINLIIPVLISLAVLGLFVGVFRYGFSLGNEDHIKEAKRIMFWGVVGLFVMVSVWGILRILAQTFLR